MPAPRPAPRVSKSTTDVPHMHVATLAVPRSFLVHRSAGVHLRRIACSSKDKMAEKGIKEGDEVQWKWGSGRPQGTAAEKFEDHAEIQTKGGKTVTRNADPENPAFRIEGARNPVLKKASELTKVGDGGEDEEEEEEEVVEDEEEEKA